MHFFEAAEGEEGEEEGDEGVGGEGGPEDEVVELLGGHVIEEVFEPAEIPVDMGDDGEHDDGDHERL